MGPSRDGFQRQPTPGAATPLLLAPESIQVERVSLKFLYSRVFPPANVAYARAARLSRVKLRRVRRLLSCRS